jgi:hypothetical protein
LAWCVVCSILLEPHIICVAQQALRLINATAAEREADRELRFTAGMLATSQTLARVVLAVDLRALLDKGAGAAAAAVAALARFEATLAEAECESPDSYLTDGGDTLIGAEVDEAARDAARKKAEACQRFLADVEEGEFQIRFVFQVDATVLLFFVVVLFCYSRLFCVSRGCFVVVLFCFTPSCFVFTRGCCSVHQQTPRYCAPDCATSLLTHPF